MKKICLEASYRIKWNRIKEGNLEKEKMNLIIRHKYIDIRSMLHKQSYKKEPGEKKNNVDMMKNLKHKPKVGFTAIAIAHLIIKWHITPLPILLTSKSA